MHNDQDLEYNIIFNKDANTAIFPHFDIHVSEVSFDLAR